MDKILTIGIAGGSGSGKTTLANKLLEVFGDDICIVHHDNYYKAHDDLTFEERTHLNYDHPDSFETSLMIEHLEQLKQGKSIFCPVYDYTVHNRSSEVFVVEPRPVILVEGILIYTEPELVDQLDVKVFVETDADIRLGRRVLRDAQERGRSVESVVTQWQNTVKPMYEKYVEPSKEHADIIIPEGKHNPVALDLLIGHISRHLESCKE